MVTPRARMRNFRATRPNRRKRPLWLQRSARLHALACPGRSRGGHRACLHGASSGNEIVAIANVIFGGKMRARFHAEPRIRATELLLQERASTRCSRGSAESTRGESVRPARRGPDPEVRAFCSASAPHDRITATHLLSNGRYSGDADRRRFGYSRWGDIA